MNPLMDSAAERALRYLSAIDARPVAPDPDAVERLHELDEALPEGPTDPEQVLALLDERCSPATTATAGSRFFGFVIGGSLPVTLAANWLAAAWDQATGLYRITPATAHLEQLTLAWLLDLLGLPPESEGAFVTGASVANLCALAAARHGVYERAGWDVDGDGLVGAPPLTVIIGGEAHPSVVKALGLLGLGRRGVHRVPVDGQGRMRVDLLPEMTGPTIVCAQAGNVNTGAFDAVDEICARAHEAGAWVHVDAAFGLWAMATPGRAHLTRGLADADSWATDAHKWLNVPYDCGIAFVRHRGTLRAAMAITAEYLPTETEYRNPSDFTPELSRRARGVEVWAALKALGRQGVADLVEGTCRHAQAFADGLSEAGYEILNEVVLNQVLVSFGDPETTERVIADIQLDGTCWCGGTIWQGRTAMRISVSSWATTDEDVRMSLDAILRCAARRRPAT
ncbi:MAG: aminotransferase class V-fold PLP-dependent enzyme [Gemmatimonadetes bacterium]|nr:aminotransferase class V-fold PLP-dependent enzyme [Gemmatimonadota bacterium]